MSVQNFLMYCVDLNLFFYFIYLFINLIQCTLVNITEMITALLHTNVGAYTPMQYDFYLKAKNHMTDNCKAKHWQTNQDKQKTSAK